jgi:hypothetical protein
MSPAGGGRGWKYVVMVVVVMIDNFVKTDAIRLYVVVFSNCFIFMFSFIHPLTPASGGHGGVKFSLRNRFSRCRKQDNTSCSAGLRTLYQPRSHAPDRR